MVSIKNLTEGTIRKQILALALPILGTSFIQMAYSIINMAWVGRLGSEAVAAVGSVGILIWMTNSMAYLNKVGAEISVGQSIGAKDLPAARSFAGHNLTITLLLSFCWLFLLYSCAEPIIGFYHLDPDVAEKAVEFLRIIATAFPFIFLSMAFTGIYNAAGLSHIPFYVNGAGLALNITLDPLFIYGFGWGTSGAAWATWIAQISVCLCFIYFLKRKHRILGGFPLFVRLEKDFVKKILTLGLPVTLLNVFFASINLVLARTASLHGGSIGVSALTAGGQLEALAWNTSQGFSTALSTFVAQNFAAGKKDRVLGAFYTTLRIALVIGICCTILFVCFGSNLFSLIVPDPEAYHAGGAFLRIDGYSMLFMMLEITSQGIFYGTGRTLPPAIISIAGNSLRIPLAIGLAAAGLGLHGVWWAISISSMLKGIAAFIWFRFLRKRVLF